MIWRLGRPVAGILAGLAIAAGLSAAIGFGVGMPELLAIALVTVAVTFLVGGRRPRRSA